MNKNHQKRLRLWAIPLALAALLWLSCSKDYEREPGTEVATNLLADVPELLQQAVTRRSARNFLGTPLWEQHRLIPTGDGMPLLVLALPATQLPNGWKAELVCALDTATHILNVHVMVLPAEPSGRSYTAYSFGADGSWRYSLTARNGRLRATLPQQPTRYTDMTLGEPALQAHNSDEKVCAVCGKRHADVNGGTLDESVVTAPRPQEYWDSILPDIIGGLWNMNPDHEFVYGGGGNDTPPNLNPKDPCGQAKIMSSDAGVNGRATTLMDKMNTKQEEGYVVKNGTSYPPDKNEEKRVTFVLNRNEKCTEMNHTHHLGDVLAFDSGDLKVQYQLYNFGNMEDPLTFRFMITIEDHVLCLQITDEDAYKAFAKRYWLGNKNSKKLRDAMSVFFEENGIPDVLTQFERPTRTPEELTSTLAAFFAAQKNGAGLSVSVGKRNGSQVEWEAKEVDGSTTGGSTPPKTKKRCN